MVVRLFFLHLIGILSIAVNAHELNLAIGQERWLYQEWNSWDDELDREYGRLPGVKVGLVAQVTDTQQLRWSLQYHQAEIDYDGYLQNGQPHQAKTEETTKRVRFGWRLNQQHTFVGIGVQKERWQRDILASGSVQHNLYEYYRWLGPSVELGAVANVNRWNLTLTTEFIYWLSNYMDVDFSPFGNDQVSLKKATVTIPNSIEAMANMQLGYRLTENWQLNIIYELGIRQMDASNSVPIGGGLSAHEPKSRLFWYSTWLGASYYF